MDTEQIGNGMVQVFFPATDTAEAAFRYALDRPAIGWIDATRQNVEHEEIPWFTVNGVTVNRVSRTVLRGVVI